jgi:hypothetical protein
VSDVINLNGLAIRPDRDEDPHQETSPHKWPTASWSVRYTAAAAAAGVMDGQIAARRDLLADRPGKARAARWLTQFATDPRELAIAPTAVLPDDLWARIALPDGIPPQGLAHLRTVYFNAFNAAGTAAKLHFAAEILHVL